MLQAYKNAAKNLSLSNDLLGTMFDGGSLLVAATVASVRTFDLG